MHITISPLAEKDLEDIVNRLAATNPDAALRWIAELRVAIGNPPAAYRKRPELGNDVSSCTVGDYAVLSIVAKNRLNIACILPRAFDLPEVAPASASGA